MSKSIFEVHVDPFNEEDLPSAELLTQVFDNLRQAFHYASSLAYSTTFKPDEIVITSYYSFTLRDYNHIERKCKHGK